MAIICPKCRTVRAENATVPDWQCPSCGVAYAKAGGSSGMERQAVAVQRGPEGRGLPWGKILLVLAVAYGGWVGFNHSRSKGGEGSALSSLTAKFGGSASSSQLSALGAATREGDVIMYSAVWCPNCTAAKNWMNTYGFKYHECDVDKSADCASQFRSMNSNGIPYLVVKGHHMKEGFDSDEFIAAVQKPGTAQ